MQGRTQQKTNAKNYSYWPWIKASGVLAFTTLGFFGLKASGILSTALAWLFPQQNSKDNALISFSKNTESDFSQLNEVSSDKYSHVSLMDDSYTQDSSKQSCNSVNCLNFINIFRANQSEQGLSLAKLSDGNLILAYQNSYTGPISGQLLSANGQNIGNEFPITDPHAEGIFLKNVISNSQGNFLVTWHNYSESDEINLQFFRNNGTKITEIFTLPSDDELSGLPSDGSGKIIDFNGKFLVIAKSHINYCAPWWYGEIFNNNGTLENQFQLFPSTGTDNNMTYSCKNNERANVAALPNNNFIVTTSGDFMYDFPISARIFNNTGFLYKEFYPATNAAQSAAPIIVNTDNGFFILWIEESFTTILQNFRSQFFNSSYDELSNDGFTLNQTMSMSSDVMWNHLSMNPNSMVAKINNSKYLLAYSYNCYTLGPTGINFNDFRIQGFDKNGTLLPEFSFTMPDSSIADPSNFGIKSFDKIGNNEYIINALYFSSHTGLSAGYAYHFKIIPNTPSPSPNYPLIFGLIGGGVGLVATTIAGACIYKKCKKDHTLENRHRTARNSHKSSITPQPTETRTTKFEEGKKESFSLPTYTKESPSAPPLQSSTVEEPSVPPSYEETNKDDTCKSCKNKSTFFSNNKTKNSTDPFIPTTAPNGEIIYKNSHYEWRKVEYDHSLKEWAERVDCDEAKFDADLVCPIKMRPMYDALSYNIKGSSDLQTISEEATLEWFPKSNLCPKTGKEVTAISINSTVRNIVAHKFEDMKRQPTKSIP